MNRTPYLLASLLAACTGFAALPARADLALATSRNCMACHAVERKVVGPSYKSVAAKYAGQNVTERLAGKIMKGGAGVWGPVPMPANSQVTDTEAHRLANWILGLK